VAKPPADNAFALALQGVKRSIEDQTREREDAARRAAAAARARGAGRDLFRKAVADVTPLPPSDRLEPPRPEVPAWPAQRVADEQLDLGQARGVLHGDAGARRRQRGVAGAQKQVAVLDDRGLSVFHLGREGAVKADGVAHAPDRVGRRELLANAGCRARRAPGADVGRLEQRHRVSGEEQLARREHARDPSADDHHARHDRLRPATVSARGFGSKAPGAGCCSACGSSGSRWRRRPPRIPGIGR